MWKWCSSLFAPPGGFEQPGALAAFRSDVGLKPKSGRDVMLNCKKWTKSVLSRALTAKRHSSYQAELSATGL